MIPYANNSFSHYKTHLPSLSSRIGLDTMLENQRASNFARNVVHIEDPTLGRKIEEVRERDLGVREEFYVLRLMYDLGEIIYDVCVRGTI